MIDPLPVEVVRMEREERVHPTNKRAPRKADKGASIASLDLISSSLELFEGLSKRELKKLRRNFVVVSAEEGARLGRQGTPCHQFTVVLTGQVAITFNDEPLGVIPPGCFFGAVAMLDPDDHSRRGSPIVLEPSVLAVANRQEFKTIMRDFPVVAGRIASVAERRRQALNERMAAEADPTVEIETEFPIHAMSTA